MASAAAYALDGKGIPALPQGVLPMTNTTWRRRHIKWKFGAWPGCAFRFGLVVLRDVTASFTHNSFGRNYD
jgi:hypothetical protein